MQQAGSASLVAVIPLPKDHKDGLWGISSGLKLSALERK